MATESDTAAARGEVLAALQERAQRNPDMIVDVWAGPRSTEIGFSMKDGITVTVTVGARAIGG